MKHGFDRQVKPTIDQIHPGHVARYEFAKSRVSGYVLDAACGVGYGSYLLSDVADVTGVDIEQEAIEYARTHYAGPNYYVGDIEKSSVGKGYDWIVSFETIEHLKDPKVVLLAFREAPKLIISTPNELEFPFKPEDHAGSTYPHIRHYTPNEFEELLMTCGWKPVEKLGQKTKMSSVSRGTGKFLVWVCE
jgi:2-polyprenyl-3-methyl-5-hydroxy-6-metoxy-1,4-benzoquinol methylase